MHRPTYLTPYALSLWIPELIRDKKMYAFYHTAEWQQLREQILQANHYECEDCRRKTPLAITPATTVHHDREVERFPELALSTYWIDARGKKHQQLFALCEDCHNARHKRFGYDNKQKAEEPLTKERW